jgi:hypothetical protein
MADRVPALDARPAREPDGVVVSIGLDRGDAQLAWRWRLPAGEAVSVMRALPKETGSLEAALQDIAGQFGRYCKACGFAPGECIALSLLVRRTEHVAAARRVGGRLGARGVRVVLMRPEIGTHVAVQLIATFSRRLA